VVEYYVVLLLTLLHTVHNSVDTDTLRQAITRDCRTERDSSQWREPLHGEWQRRVVARRGMLLHRDQLSCLDLLCECVSV
jgi:hypothetical protein